MPPGWNGAPSTSLRAIGSLLLITVHPERVAPPVLAEMDGVVAVGGAPGSVRGDVGAVSGRVEGESGGVIVRRAPDPAPAALSPGEVLVCMPGDGPPPVRLRTVPARG